MSPGIGHIVCKNVQSIMWRAYILVPRMSTVVSYLFLKSRNTQPFLEIILKIMFLTIFGHGCIARYLQVGSWHVFTIEVGVGYQSRIINCKHYNSDGNCEHIPTDGNVYFCGKIYKKWLLLIELQAILFMKKKNSTVYCLTFAGLRNFPQRLRHVPAAQPSSMSWWRLLKHLNSRFQSRATMWLQSDDKKWRCVWTLQNHCWKVSIYHSRMV